MDSQCKTHVPRAPLLSHLNAVYLLMLSAIFSLSPQSISHAQQFNLEVGQRVRERLIDYLGDPITIARLIVEHRENGGFAHSMDAPDRNEYLKLSDAMMQLYPQFEAVYFGLENGVFIMHSFGLRVANYREPGESGFAIDDESMQKYFESCVGEDGTEEYCVMVPGNSYIQCIDGCSLNKCPGDESQKNCTSIVSDEEREDCEKKVKWCKNYVRKTAPEEGEGPQLGFVPRFTHCIDRTGVVSQTPGAIVKKGTDELGVCYYRDGATRVERTLAGDYAFCGGNGKICNDTFVGAYLHRDYDPRWRGWYEATKAQQRSNWSPPYPFFSNLDIGITYSEPIYSLQNGKNIFMGVVAVDYTFSNITEFLKENFWNTTTVVAIFEEEEPHYIIASSTGSKGARKVLASDKTKPCLDVNTDQCTAQRVTMAELSDVSGSPIDGILSNSFVLQKEDGFPSSNIVSVKAGDGGSVYVSLTQPFRLPPGVDLNWSVMIMNPTRLFPSDSILKGYPFFGVIIAIGTTGFVICVLLFWLFFKKRNKTAIQVSDWRFTSAFILGCALLNTATFSFLGPNIDSLCMLRMWMFHFLFAVTFSPLLVKTYRMMKLVGGGRSLVRVNFPHEMAMMYTLPIISTQLIILVIFSVVDPSKQTEIIEMDGSDVSHRVICAQETNAFFIVQLVFEGGLVLLGCALAYETRHLQQGFHDASEAKQLILSMYGIGVAAIIIVVMSSVMGNNQAANRLLYAVGIGLGTVFCSCVFALSRLIQARDTASTLQRFTLHRIGSAGTVAVNGLIGMRSFSGPRNLLTARSTRRGPAGSDSPSARWRSASSDGMESATAREDEVESLPKSSENNSRTQGDSPTQVSILPAKSGTSADDEVECFPKPSLNNSETQSGSPIQSSSSRSVRRASIGNVGTGSEISFSEDDVESCLMPPLNSSQTQSDVLMQHRSLSWSSRPVRRAFAGENRAKSEKLVREDEVE